MDSPRLHVVFIADCSSSMNGYKIELVNKAIQDLIVFLTGFSKEHSLDPYIGIIRLSASATWLTDPEILPLSSFPVQDLPVIDGEAHPSAAFHLLKPVLETINRAFPAWHRYWMVDPIESFQELPVVFLLSDGNFYESREEISKSIDETIAGKCIRIPVTISNILPDPHLKVMWVFDRLGIHKPDDPFQRPGKPDKDYNFPLLDSFRADSFNFGQPFIDPVHVLELGGMNMFFTIPFKRQTARDE